MVRDPVASKPGDGGLSTSAHLPELAGLPVNVGQLMSLTLLASEQPRPKVVFQPAGPQATGTSLDLLGTYWGPVEFTLALRLDGRLDLRASRLGRDCSFRPNGDGTYRGEPGYFDGEQLTPTRREDGSLSHLDVASFVLTRSPYSPQAPIPGGVDEKGWHSW